MNVRSLFEMALESKLKQGLSHDDAVKTAVDLLDGSPGLSGIVVDYLREHQSRIESRTKLTELGTARHKDILAMGWYAGVDDEQGVWGALRRRMVENGLADAVDQINRSTEEIVASIAQPHVDNDRRRGLVIGNVQSGKTANFSAVAAKALDSGYKFVLVLSGIHNNLRKQTQLRLERDLGVDPKNWCKLTDADGDFGTAYNANASGIVANYDRVLAVVKKNGTRLRNVLAFLRALDDQTKRKTPFLIIDDESDQATPDSSTKVEDDPTTINQLMREIWAEVANGTYVGYTATPFANVFMDPNSEQRGGLEDLYPKDFIHVMPTPRNYFGAERIFGLDGEDRLTPDVVRVIPDRELATLAPKNDAPEVTTSLAEAIKWFVVASAIRRVRGQQSKHSTMLIHTTHRVAPHFAMRDAVEHFLEPLRRAAREDEVDAFLEIFHEERDRAAELYTGLEGAPSWQLVRREIPNVLWQLRVSVDNGSADSDLRLAYSDDPQTVIVIGGGTLSRGLTLEGLFVSFFTRTSNTYDTLLQMGRWFGYRPGYEDLQRVWMSPGLDDDYRFLATIESEVRAEVARMTDAGQTPEEIGVRVRLHPGRLQITSPAKMKHVKVARADFEGFRLQTTRFDMSNPAQHEDNVRTVLDLRKRLAPFRSARAADLHTDVPVSELTEFFERFNVHPRYAEMFHDAHAWSSEMLPDKTWNVIVPFEDSTGSFRPVVRTPVKDPFRGQYDVATIDIRALMSQNDILKDLHLQDPNAIPESALKNTEQMDRRKERADLDGRGLLILYPISRTSKSRDRKLRDDMDSVLRDLAPSLLENPDAPLMGVALVAPFDTDRTLTSKGTSVAVQPVFGEPETLDDAPIVDNEADFRSPQL